MKRTFALLLLMLALAVSAACSRAPDPTPSPYTGYLTEGIPPCTPVEGISVDPCESDDKIVATLFGYGDFPVFLFDEPFPVRDFLDGSSLFSAAHVVLRGTYIPNTVRCTSGNPYRVPSYVEPGYFQHSILIQCFADIRVNNYILGSGPPRLPLLVSFLHYWDGYYATIAADEGITEDEVVEQIRTGHVLRLERAVADNRGVSIYGREMVVFIGPGHNHATEVWELFETWDVQRQEDDTVIVVHPQRDVWREKRPDVYQTFRSTLEMDLPTFTQSVMSAHQARVTEYGGRIGPADIDGRAEGVELPMLVTDVNQLRQYFIDTGAHDHPDGPPVHPPPP